MECFDDLFELIEICLEVIVLEKVYKEVLEIFNKVQKEYEQVKKIWEEFVNCFDCLE